ncbi:expressed unknown protein [Seminavis robusta]|uniref:Uncharacterized protein n=1 Tax=Seminavis robusta TaxID=568900 RepID=A0A9N8E273_9STRA|nr:expressed unknown protein [Seminavis robusta]|eukprot:Sro432_g141730.1 n/a (184) ;mRNA; f:62352-62903
MCCSSPLQQFLMANFSTSNLIVIDDNAAAPAAPTPTPSQPRRISRRSRIEQRRRGRGPRRQQQVQSDEPQLCRWGSLPISTGSPERTSPQPAFMRSETHPVPSGIADAPQRPQRRGSMTHAPSAPAMNQSKRTGTSSPRKPQRKGSLNASTMEEDYIMPVKPTRKTPKRSRPTKKVVVNASTA